MDPNISVFDVITLMENQLKTKPIYKRARFGIKCGIRDLYDTWETLMLNMPTSLKDI